MKNERWIWGGIVLLLFGCIIGLVWYHESKSETKLVTSQKIPEKVLTVDTVTVQPHTVTLKQKYIGTVVPVQSVAVLPYISGFIDQVLVQGGQHVKAGETLFVIQQRQYSAQKEVAAANVQSAQAALNNAHIYLDRIERTKSKAISQTELDNARTSFLSAQADLKAAQSRLTVAEVNYDYTVIRSPIEGIVGNVPITKGNYVSPNGEALVRIIQQSPIRVVFTMSNRDYLEIVDKGNHLFQSWVFRLRLATGELYAQPGVFQYVDNQITGSTSSISVYVDFPNPNGKLIANAYVDVLLEKTAPNTITLDQNLVHLTDKEAFVYLLENGKITQRSVLLGMSLNHQYVIESGLRQGDEVIIGTIPADLIGKKAEKRLSKISAFYEFKRNALFTDGIRNFVLNC